MRTQIQKIDQLIRAPGKLRFAQEVITAEDAQVFFRRERFNQCVFLQGHAKPGADGSQVLLDVLAEDPDCAAARTGDAVYHAQGRCLARSVRAQKPEASLWRDL